MKKRGIASIIIPVIIAYLGIFYYFIFYKTGFRVDEETHAWIISSFFRGDYIVLNHLTVIPGYHFFSSLFLSLFNQDTIELKRLFNVITGIAAIVIFYLTERNYAKASSNRIKSLQFAFVPLIMPFFFLIYTDPLALLFVILANYFFHKKKYQLSGTSLIFSMLVRQSNVIWIFYFMSLSVFESDFKLKKIKEEWKNYLLEFIEKNLTNLLGLILFFIFMFINGGIALGDKAQHPSFTLSSGNLYLTGFLLVFLNLPYAISQSKSIAKLISEIFKNKLQAVVFLSIVTASAIHFFNFFKLSHPYNNPQSYYWIIRNIFLEQILNNNLYKIGFFIIMIYAILMLWDLVKERKQEALAFIFFSVLALSSFWLIEVRYAIIPLALYQLLRKPASQKTEITQLGYNIILSGISIYTIVHTIYFF